MFDFASIPSAGVARRRFLQLLGGSVLLPGLPAAVTATERCRIGVLVPDSHRYPPLGGDLLAGLRWGLATGAAPAELVRINNYGLRFSHGARQAADWVRTGAVDLLVGVLCRDHAVALRPLLARHGVPLLVCDAGADPPGELRQDLYLSWHSLGYWQSNRAAGQQVARQGGRRVVLSMGLYENGYALGAAFAAGLQAAGGELVATHVAEHADGSGTPSRLAALIRRERPDLLYALYSGAEAARFLAFYRDGGLARRAPLMVGGLTLAGLPANPDAPPLATDWPAGAEGVPFALLGFEAGLRIASALATAGPWGPALAGALADTAIDEARGRLPPASAGQGVSGWINPYLVS